MPNSETLQRRMDATHRDEKELLGEILRNPSRIAEVASGLQIGQLTDYSHRCVFKALLSLWESSASVTLDSVANELQRQGADQDITPANLAGIWECGGVGLSVPRLVRILRSRAVLRNLAEASEQILAAVDATQVREGDEGEQLLTEAYSRLYRCSEGAYEGGPRPFKEAIQACYDRLDRRAAGKESPGFGTGFTDLDRLFAGFRAQELTVLAARPSVGKTALALCLAMRAARNGAVTLFASLEQPDIDLAERALAAESKVFADVLRRGDLQPQEVSTLTRAGDRLGNLRVWVDDSPKQDLLRLSADAQRVRATENRLDLVVVDYLQLLTPPAREGRRQTSRQEEVAGVSMGLKQLARSLDCSVLALAQLNRDVEQRKGKPRLSDLRDSGQLEQDADCVMFLHRESAPEPGLPHELDVIVAKQRNGPVGECQVEMDGATYAFGDVVRTGF